jgi:uncharacterized Tic20 family protein
MTTGQFIKNQRLEKGVTQEELSSKTSISVRTIQRIENDEVVARAYTLRAISAALGFEFSDMKDMNIATEEKTNVWLSVIHLSGLPILLLPPFIIWLLKRDAVLNIHQHAIDVINFQISMLLFIVPCGLFAALLFPVFILILLLLYSTFIILVNSIKVYNGQPYSYPLSLKLFGKK